MDPTSELNRFEEKIRPEEARARDMEEVAASSIDDQTDDLDDIEDDLEIEARLASFKGS